MKRVSGKIYLPKHFFWSANIHTNGKDRMGQVRSGQFVSGHIRTEYSLPKFLDSKYFERLKVSSTQNFLDPNFFVL